MRKACRICTGGMEREMNKETESGKTYPDDIKSEGPEKKDIAKLMRNMPSNSLRSLITSATVSRHF